MYDDTALINRIQTALHRGRESDLDELALDSTLVWLQEEQFPEGVLEFIIGLMGDSEFWQLNRAWYVLRLLQNDWDRLSVDHKSRILPNLEAAFRISRDDMVWFLIALLLGEGFANRDAFEVLSRLKLSDIAAARAVVPIGLEEMCRNAIDRGIADLARRELLQMTDDASWEVRREAGESLQRLSR